MIWTLAVTLLSPVVIGYLLVRSLLPPHKPAWAGIVFTASLGAGLGVGVLSFLYFLIWLLAGPSNAAYWVGEILLLGIAGAACWIARKRVPTDGHFAAPKGWSWLLLGILVVALGMAASMFVDSSVSDPHGAWDAWAIWNLRAKILAQHNAHWKDAFSPLLNLLAGFGATHGDYPLLLSGYIARCWSLTGGAIDDITPPIAVAGLFSFATVGLMVSGLALVRGWSTSMIGGLVLLGTAGFLLDTSWQLADIPLAFFYLSVFVLLFLMDADSGSGATAALAGLALGCAAWTKDEGFVFAGLAALSLGLYLLLSKGNGKARLAPFMAGAAAPLLIVLCFKFFLAPKGASWGPLTLSVAMHHLVQPSRYGRIAKALWDEGVALGTGIANPVVYLAVFAACLGVQRERLRKPVVVAGFAAWLATFAAYLFIYVVTPFDLSWQLGTSLGRLLVQLTPSAIFLVLAVCRTVEETAVLPEALQNSDRVSRKKAKRMQASKA